MSMPAGQFDRRARLAFVLACATLLVGGVGFKAAVLALNLYLRKEPVELRRSLTLIPTSLGSWQILGADRSMPAEMVETLGTDKYLDRDYIQKSKGGSARLSVHLAYYTGMIDTVPHVPDRCMVAAGFIDKTLPDNLPLEIDKSDWSSDPEGRLNLATNSEYTVAVCRDILGQLEPVRLPIGDFKLRTVEFESEKDPSQRIFGGYFFIANGQMTPSPEGVKMFAFDPRQKYAYYCKVQYVYWDREGTQKKFLQLTADHLKYLLPELMRCLPDWSEVERRDQPPQEKPVT